MVFPRCGKVLVIDDQIEEAMPLLNLLGKKGIPAVYYSGNLSELPESPFDEIRLVFCDLKYNAAPDGKSIASNVLSILKALISEQNGPYILLVWSAHGADYLGELQKTLEATEIKPEFILQLDKGEFFVLKDNGAHFDEIIDSVSELDLDPTDENRVKKLIEEKTCSLRNSKRELLPEALENIERKLSEELKKANLFHLFVLWENTIAMSAIETVNSIYEAIPDTIPANKKLRAMLFYLAHYRLEKQLEGADEEVKFRAAMDSLNELFSYFFFEKAHNLSLEQVELDRIQDIQEIKDLSDAKFNQWKMLTSGNKGHHPGNIYRDPEKCFQFHGLIAVDAFKKAKEYQAIVDELGSNANIEYILVDISSDCDIAQKKIFVSRVVPGVMIPTEDITRYRTEKKIKHQSGEPDYIFSLSPVEFNKKSWYIAFNVNQMFALQMDKLVDANLMYALTGSYIISLKQTSASCVSKHGIEVFGAGR